MSGEPTSDMNKKETAEDKRRDSYEIENPFLPPEEEYDDSFSDILNEADKEISGFEGDTSESKNYDDPFSDILEEASIEEEKIANQFPLLKYKNRIEDLEITIRKLKNIISENSERYKSKLNNLAEAYSMRLNECKEKIK